MTIEFLFVFHKLEQIGQQIVPNLEDMRTHVPGRDKTLGHFKVFNWERVNPQTPNTRVKTKNNQPYSIGSYSLLKGLFFFRFSAGRDILWRQPPKPTCQ